MPSSILRKFTVYEFLARMYFHVPVLVVFFRYKGVPLDRIGWLYAAFALVTLVLEIPAGWLADRWGHRNVLAAGGFLQVTGLLILVFFSGFEWMMAGEVVFAAGETFLSGITYAYLYELCLKYNRQKSYSYWQRQAVATVMLAALFAGVSGSFFYDLNPYLPFLLSVGVNGAGAVYILFFPKADRVVSLKKQLFPLRHLSRTLIVWLLVNGIIFSLTITFKVAVFQILLEEIGVPVRWFGLIIAGAHGISFLATRYYERIYPGLTSERGAFLIPLLMLAAVVLMYFFSWYIIPGGIMLIMLGSVHRPLALSVIQDRIESERRSTILSWSQFFGGITSFLYFMLWTLGGVKLSGKFLLIEAAVLLLFCQLILFIPEKIKRA